MLQSAPKKSPLLEHVRQCLRLKHYSIRTEQTYLQCIKRFILFHHKRHPAEMGVDEIRQYLSHLATSGKVAASTQNVELSALLFLYREVLGQDLPFVDGIERAKQPQRVPTVFTRDEVRAVLAKLPGTYHLMASLLYGTGMRLMECVRLRVKDIDFGYQQITVRDGKGGKDRRTMLPESLAVSLRRQLERARLLHEEDLQNGYGRVYLPNALARKYPNAAREWAWQWCIFRSNSEPISAWKVSHLQPATSGSLIRVFNSDGLREERDAEDGSSSCDPPQGSHRGAECAPRGARDEVEPPHGGQVFEGSRAGPP